MKSVKSLFVPSTCLQGSKLPVHVIWSKEKDLKISVRYPDSFEVSEIFNGKPSLSESNPLVFSEFEENGYIGIVFNTKKVSENRLKVTIDFTFEEAGGNIGHITRGVHCFRPDVKVVHVPSVIEIKKDKDGKYYASDRIQVVNCGEGTAVLSLVEREETELRIREPHGIGEFITNFWSDFIEGLSHLKNRYPDHAELLDKLIGLKDKLSKVLDEAEVKGLKDLVEELENILITDSSFSEEYESTVQVAYIKNLKFITELESFLIYLKSTDSERLLLKNPINVLNLEPRKKNFRANLNIIDLNYNSYPKVPISFEICATEACELPLHKLLYLQSNGGQNDDRSIS